MLSLILALAVSCPVSQTAPPGKPRAIFSEADYPLEAVRHHWEGTAVAELSIDVQGKVAACRIVKSTGHQVLDDATCNLLTTRARFVPAHDDNCNPAADTFRTPTIAWKLP